MNTLKFIFSSLILAILMIAIIPVSAVIAVGIGFLILIEDATMGDGFGLGLILFFASPITFIVLVGCFERELWTYWFRREDSALDLILG